MKYQFATYLNGIDQKNISIDGLKSIIKSIDVRLGVWSISKYDRRQLEGEKAELLSVLKGVTNDLEHKR